MSSQQAASEPQVTVKIPCHVGWKLLQEYDNSGNKHTTITRSVKVTQYKEITGKDYTKVVNESSREAAQKAHIDVSSSATWGSVSAEISAGFEASEVLKDFVSSTTEVTREETSKSEYTEAQDYSIGPGDKLYFYQQIFSGPGIYFALDTTSVTSREKGPDDEKEVDIIVLSSPVRFIADMDVAYGDKESDAPEDRVRTFQGSSDDINRGFAGKYVWMVPRWTIDTEKAATSFDIFIQKNSSPGLKDLAAGAGGDYRYVVANHDAHQLSKVRGATLIRSSDKAVSVEQQEAMLGKGWVGGNRDINEGRHGDWLHLAYELY